ncbi:uncharacterized protein BP5553_06180 [Venustampulla echinocandica]|uniref:Uncharacterized protein n=1 Tax=Venustampulla echinocandica TaxID=2656787 RepID=A0A370TMU4_9HELO|nr:uncharacterized protein BP5553_06180 [Venustampulla echinocandica]RDL36828.1 hypothetical protein BP5553_06180 [Venustampulla echinocandica]
MPPPQRSKHQTCIEVWRNEVSAHTPASPTYAPQIQRPSFWRRLLRPRSFNSHSSNEEMGNGSGFIKRAKKSKEADVRTEMYSQSEEDRSKRRGNGGEAEDGDVRDGSSMELASGSDEFGGLRGRMERLERARRLLDGGGRGGGGGSRKG